MESKSSLPHSQQPATCPYPDTDWLSLCSPPFHFSIIHFTIIFPSTPGSSKWSSSLKFSHQNPVCTSVLPIRAACPTDLIILDLITRMIFGEEFRAKSSFWCSLLYSSVTSSLSVPNTPLSTLFSKTLCVHSSLFELYQVSHPYKTTCKMVVRHVKYWMWWKHVLSWYYKIRMFFESSAPARFDWNV